MPSGSSSGSNSVFMNLYYDACEELENAKNENNKLKNYVQELERRLKNLQETTNKQKGDLRRLGNRCQTLKSENAELRKAVSLADAKDKITEESLYLKDVDINFLVVSLEFILWLMELYFAPEFCMRVRKLLYDALGYFRRACTECGREVGDAVIDLALYLRTFDLSGKRLCGGVSGDASQEDSGNGGEKQPETSNESTGDNTDGSSAAGGDATGTSEGEPAGNSSEKDCQKSRAAQPGGAAAAMRNLNKLMQQGGVIVQDGGTIGEPNGQDPVERYTVGLQLQTVVTVYTVYPDENGKYPIPPEHAGCISFDESIPALAASVQTAGLVSIDQTAGIISALLGIDVSPAAVTKHLKKCANLVDSEAIPVILSGLNNAEYVHTDRAVVNVNGCARNVQNLSTSNHVSYFTDGPAAFFVGCDFFGNPDLTFVSNNGGGMQYLRGNYNTCAAYILETLTQIYEETKSPWICDMKNFLNDLNQIRDDRMKKGDLRFTEDELAGYYSRYEKIIVAGLEQNAGETDGPLILCRKSEQNVLDFLREHRDKVLLFLVDWNIPFSDDMSTQDLGRLRDKIATSRMFRTDEGFRNFLSLLSFMETMKRQGFPVYMGFLDLMLGGVDIYAEAPAEPEHKQGEAGEPSTTGEVDGEADG